MVLLLRSESLIDESNHAVISDRSQNIIIDNIRFECDYYWKKVFTEISTDGKYNNYTVYGATNIIILFVQKMRETGVKKSSFAE